MSSHTSLIVCQHFVQMESLTTHQKCETGMILCVIEQRSALEQNISDIFVR